MFSCTYIHSLEKNEIGPQGVQHLLTAFEKMVNLQKLE